MINHRRSYLLSIAIAVSGSILFSGKAILIKLAYQYGTTSEVLLALRMIFAFPLFWLVYLCSKERKNNPPLLRKDLLKILWLGFSGYFISSYLDFLGLYYISAGLERIILYLTPAIVIVISYFVLHKPISKLQWLSILIGYVGVILAFIEDVGGNNPNIWLGVGLVFASACFYAGYLIFSGEMVKRIGSIRLVTYASSFSAFFSILQIVFHSPQAIIEQVPQIYFLSLINALVCTVFPIVMTMISIERIGSSLTSQAGILGPVSTIFLGWYFLKEEVNILQIFGLILVIGAVWLLVNNKEPKSDVRTTVI